jgi:hypothetical protein
MTSLQKFIATFAKRLSKVSGSTIRFAGDLSVKVTRKKENKK